MKLKIEMKIKPPQVRFFLFESRNVFLNNNYILNIQYIINKQNVQKHTLCPL